MYKRALQIPSFCRLINSIALINRPFYSTQIEILSKEFIKPSSPTPHHLKTFNLSILDQLILAPYAPIILYYPNDQNNSQHSLFQALQRSQTLKNSLSKTLTQFYPLAGMIKNHLSIDCNDIGANYVLALVHGELGEFLNQPDHHLINKFLPVELSFDESSAGAVVTNVQVNVFKCGGIAIGLCVSHKVLDGAALSIFLRAWANMAKGNDSNEELVYPNLTAPLKFPARNLGFRDIAVSLYQSQLKEGKCCTKRFIFDANAIARLKSKARKNGVQKPTRVEVVSGLIWKCAMAASKGTTSRISHMVNLRSKFDDKTSKDMIGNMFWIATAVCKRSEGGTLSDLVNKVHESIAKINKEFVSKAQSDEEYVVFKDSLKEMGEIGLLEEVDNYSFTSTCNMGFYGVDFGWGKPSWVTCYVCEGISVFVNLVTLMDTKCGEGVEAWVTLDEEEMRILQCNEELLTHASFVTK